VANPKAVIFGCSGAALTGAEKRFFSDVCPTGFILFERNCKEKRQVLRLVAELKEITGRSATPILIDQEGGRVQRLKPPHWRAAPAASVFAALAEKDLDLALEAVWLNAALIAAELSDLGITVDCAPVLDVPQPGAHDVIGDRAFGSEPGLIAALGKAMAQGLLDGGILPVIKHLPGHGRAVSDSHKELPVVDARPGELETADYPPFQALADMPWAMTAHVIYTALDADNPATTSATVISEIIRGLIGFDGVLVSDDIGMKALSGPFDERASSSLAAGCDLALHCSGDMTEMEETIKGIGILTADGLARIEKAETMRGTPVELDAEAARARLDNILKTA